MTDLTPKLRRDLIRAIASKEGNAQYISRKFDKPTEWLRKFVEDNKEELQAAREALSKEDQEPDPIQLEELWISNKTERLRRYQGIADELYKEALADPTDATTLREFRSYLVAAANELGQLLHRGSGEGNPDDTLAVEITGVDLDRLRGTDG